MITVDMEKGGGLWGTFRNRCSGLPNKMDVGPEGRIGSNVLLSSGTIH